jgi:hypothetical protein
MVFWVITSLNLSQVYQGVSRSFQTGCLEQELQMVQLSATRCSCVAILWASLVSSAAITLCVASQQVFIIVAYFIMDSVQKLLDTPSYTKRIQFIFVRLEILHTGEDSGHGLLG